LDACSNILQFPSIQANSTSLMIGENTNIGRREFPNLLNSLNSLNVLNLLNQTSQTSQTSKTSKTSPTSKNSFTYCP
jgi:hypothetical protein